MRNTVIWTLPHKMQRYNTWGDYMVPEGSEQRYITVSRLPNSDWEFLVALHEFIESYLCEKRGIREEIITQFDIDTPSDDPGSLETAPYHKEHEFSTMIEKQVADELEVNWDEYNGYSID